MTPDEKYRKVRTALMTLIGAESVDELRGMEAIIRISPAPARDKAQIIDAIHALLDTEEAS